MSQEQFWVLFSKKLSGEASIEELLELEQLVTEHPEWQYAVQNLTDVWQQRPPEGDLEAEDAYLLHLHRMKEMQIDIRDDSTFSITRKKSKIFYWITAAAILLTAGLIGLRKLSGGSAVRNNIDQVNEVSTRKGSRSEVRLPDGTVVWLNAGSKLTYGKNYGQQNREVTLSGEGYFDVVKMADKPFIIQTTNINIKVLGTVFNVKAYPEDRVTETSLIRGRIEVTLKNRSNDKIILAPNEKLVVENKIIGSKTEGNKENKNAAPIIAVNKIRYNPEDSSITEMQWIYNKLVFNDEAFVDVIGKMERFYDVEIELKDEGLFQKRMTGSFQKESIEQALEALTISIPFQYKREGNKIIIHR